MRERTIPVSAPVFAGNEKRYVADCMESSWISSCGEYVGRFESAFAEFCGARRALSCCNGTAALHLALAALGVGPGDEVIVPTLTFVATANAVTYCGARPVFVDSDPETWALDPSLIEGRITERTKAIIAVHLYGHPADMDAVSAIARRHNLFVVEDAAEAHGAEYKGRRVGALADISCFSFYGNKIIATGEGGMVATDDAVLASRVAQLRGQGYDPTRRYWFPVVGYNYRMMNLPAAIGLAQLERADWHLGRRREVAAWYEARLGGVPGLSWQGEQGWARHARWLFTVTLSDASHVGRDEVMSRLEQRGVETRPVFYPMHVLPPYRDGSGGGAYPVAEGLARRGLSLPTWAGLGREDIDYVCDALLESLQEDGPPPHSDGRGFGDFHAEHPDALLKEL
ncbi:MAG TPA: DegT/DnrJ/EryC1/StrS family aminotransferase [Pyrinomonadaceae bacterium]|nr:DegT/DnrJ/EryC1/StrS family aminotransferase [Pyrinomonadaceae bacterium]